MPKVSELHRTRRREQILTAARECFLRNGFQGTSMQDLFAESGLSSGAFYLYFASKDEVIVAIAEENMREFTALIHELAAAPKENGLGDALAGVIERVRKQDRDKQLSTMAVLAWSEAMRSPGLREQLASTVHRIRTDLARVIAAYQASGALPSTVSAEALMALISAVIPGTIVQIAIFGPDAVDGIEDAARAMWPALG